MFRFIQLFTEMRVIGTPDKTYKIVAFRDKIWIFPDDDITDEESRAKVEQIDEVLGTWNNSAESFYDLASDVMDSRGDILVGEVNDDVMEISAEGYFDPQSSTLIKKVFSELNLKTLKVNDEHEEYYWDFQIEGAIPDFAYHGTYSDYLPEILRLGIRSNVNPSNWQGINNSGKIFFTTKFSTASFHASRSILNEKGLPVIIRFQIPDKNRIIPDYDIENMANPKKTDKFYYGDEESHKKRASDVDWSSNRMGKEQGIYGYEGSVMPKFIREIYILTENPTEYTANPSDYYNFDIEYIKNRMKEYGDAMAFYRDTSPDNWFVEFLMADEWDLDRIVTG